MIKKVLSFLLFLSLTGCTAATTRINEIHQNFVKSFRDPGEENVSSAKEVYRSDRCESSRFSLEYIQVIPETVSPGEEVNQRLTYAFCSQDFDEKTDGLITRTIIFRGSSQFRDVTYFTYKPGKWNVDVFVEIPENAEKGRYRFEVVTEFESEKFVRSKEFTVK